jgi:hypothetical protein
MNYLMQLIYGLLGRLFFPGRQDWEQRRNAKIMVLTVAFALVLGFVVSKMIHMLYNHQK